jgi:hypothetical protein
MGVEFRRGFDVGDLARNQGLFRRRVARALRSPSVA